MHPDCEPHLGSGKALEYERGDHGFWACHRERNDRTKRRGRLRKEIETQLTVLDPRFQVKLIRKDSLAKLTQIDMRPFAIFAISE